MSDILQHWRAGEGLPDVLVIDGHVHAKEGSGGSNFASVEEVGREGAAYMDANGVDAACVVSVGYVTPGSDYRNGNDDLIALQRLLPDRLTCFVHINPNDSQEVILAELDRCERAGLRCIKLLNTYQQNYPAEGPNLMELYRFARERRMLVFNHSWPPAELARIATQFPEIDFVFGHYNPSQDAVLRERANVYANIWTLNSMGFLERGVRNVGPGKFLYGSDAFLNPMSVGIGLVVYADVPDEQKRMILGLTQAKLLDRIGALPRDLKKRFRV